MEELILIEKSKGGKVIVNARNLHEYLEITSRFNDWIINQIRDFGFVENVDFTTLTKNLVSGGKIKEYAITLDMAKELSMLARSEKGGIARKYFVACENKLREIVNQLPNFNNPIIAARAWADECEAKMLAEAKIKELQPAVNIVKALTDSRKEYGMSEVAKIMEVHDDNGKSLGRNKFFATLRRKKILRDSNEPYQRYVDAGYFIYKTHFINEMPINTAYVTGKGLAWLEYNREKIFNK